MNLSAEENFAYKKHLELSLAQDKLRDLLEDVEEAQLWIQWQLDEEGTKLPSDRRLDLEIRRTELEPPLSDLRGLTEDIDGWLADIKDLQLVPAERNDLSVWSPRWWQRAAAEWQAFRGYLVCMKRHVDEILGTFVEAAQRPREPVAGDSAQGAVQNEEPKRTQNEIFSPARLRKARKNACHSQAEAAEEIGINPRTFRRFANGENQPARFLKEVNCYIQKYAE